MTTTTPGKRGRKAKDHKCSWSGETVNGLYRKRLNLWRIRANGQEFTEPDERLAISRFHQITQALNPPTNMGKAVVHDSFHTAFRDVLQRAVGAGGSIKAQLGAPAVNKGKYVVTDESLSPAQWAWLREQFFTRRQWVAEQIGIEQIGWLSDVKRPTQSPTLKDIGDLYAAKPGLSANEAGRSKLFWKEFCKAVGIDTVRDLTHEHIGNYELAVQSQKLSPKSILHRYRKVRTILAYAIKRGRGVDDCRHALDITAMLEVKGAQPLDPKPIQVKEFWALYDAAIGAEDKTFAAMLLVALNMAGYAGEVSALRWDEIDLNAGEFVTRRPKTGVSRVCVLWPESIRALKDLPRVGDYIFNTRIRSYTVFSALDSWRKYRTAAELSDSVVFGQVRDAAFTLACRVSLDQARVLAGHRLPGQTDNYVRRDPSFVADACRAIREAFDVAKHAGRSKAK